MKVLLVNDYGTPTAGAEVMLATVRETLQARGHAVRVVASLAGLDPENSIADETCFGALGRRQVLSSTWNFSASKTIREAIRAFQPDVVHVHMFLWQLSPSILPELRNIPSIYHIHTYKPICPNGRKTLPSGQACNHQAGIACLRSKCLTPQSWIAMMAQQRLWRQHQGVFDQFITVSRCMQQRLEQAGVAPCQVIANGCPIRAARPALSGSPVIAYAGRLVPEKGIQTLLRSFALVHAQVPQARLWIAGEGPLLQQLVALARSLGIEQATRFMGKLRRAALERELDAAWIQVVPSLWEEPFGLAAIEGMMRGTAVVASRAGGLSEIVRHAETGLLVPPGDIEALAACMLRLVSDRDQCESLGAHGRSVALREYSADVHCDHMLAVYQRLCGVRACQPAPADDWVASNRVESHV